MPLARLESFVWLYFSKSCSFENDKFYDRILYVATIYVYVRVCKVFYPDVYTCSSGIMHVRSVLGYWSGRSVHTKGGHVF